MHLGYPPDGRNMITYSLPKKLNCSLINLLNVNASFQEIYSTEKHLNLLQECSLFCEYIL